MAADYGYLNASEADSIADPRLAHHPMIIMYDVFPAGFGCYFATTVPQKGRDDWVATTAAEFFKHVGHARTVFSEADGSRKNPTTEADRLNRYPQKITEVSPFGSQKDYGCQPFGPRNDYGGHPGVGFGNVKDL